MIPRYTRPEMGAIWEEENKFKIMLEIEISSAEAWAELGRVPKEALPKIRQRAKIDIVGGEDHFFNNFAKALSMGKAIDGLAEKSSTLSSIINRVVEGKPIVDKQEAESSLAE